MNTNSYNYFLQAKDSYQVSGSPAVCVTFAGDSGDACVYVAWPSSDGGSWVSDQLVSHSLHWDLQYSGSAQIITITLS